MEQTTARTRIAIVENCVMSAAGLKHLFAMPSLSHYDVNIYARFEHFNEAISHTLFSATIFSLSATREARQHCLALLRRLAVNHDGMQRIVLASNSAEARLVSHLSPVRLHGVLSKSAPVSYLLSELTALLNNTEHVNDGSMNYGFVNRVRMLSPTERIILRFLSCGYAIPEIALQLRRSAKTIRAHKFNAMLKLGVKSDIGLLDAANMLSFQAIGERGHTQRVA